MFLNLFLFFKSSNQEMRGLFTSKQGHYFTARWHLTVVLIALLCAMNVILHSKCSTSNGVGFM